MSDDSDGTGLRWRLQEAAFGPSSDEATTREARDRLRHLDAERVRAELTVAAVQGTTAELRAAEHQHVTEQATEHASGEPGPAVQPTEPSARPRLRRLGDRRILTVVGVAAVAFVAGAVVVGQPWHVIDSAAGRPASQQLAQTLSRSQVPTDRVPSTVDAPVVAASSRLLFDTSLFAAQLTDSWSVYVAAGRNAGTLCVITVPDRTADTITCFPRQSALDGIIAIDAKTETGVLTMRLDHGAIRSSWTQE